MVPGHSAPLGNDPVSAIIAVAAIAFYLLAAPLFVVAYVRRSKVAGRLVRALHPDAAPPTTA